MSSVPSTPMQRAQRFIRPKLKPKSPLRQKICLPSDPDSPTTTHATRSPTSTNSSNSGHGHGFISSAGSGMLRSYSSSGSTLSTSNSGNSLHGSTTADAQHVKVGEYSLSLPLLIVAGTTLFAGSLVLRAIVTFSASLLRLFVLVVVVVAAVTFSQFKEKQQNIQDRKAAAAAAAVKGEYSGSISEAQAPAVLDISAYKASSGSGDSKVNGLAGSQLTSPYASHNYGYGYGHAKYSSAPAAAASSNVPPPYSADGRIRQLLRPHQQA